jgi:hypothetical protein
MGKKEMIILGIICLLLILPIISAGVFGNLWSKITGKASSQNVDLNITVTSGSTPTIPRVDNQTTDILNGPNEGSSPTNILINFTAYDADGFGNLNDSSASVTVSLAGESPRTNSSCSQVIDYNTDYANYTCNITMWWFDGPGDWTITASIDDVNTNSATNNTRTFYIGTTDGVENNLTAISWPSIAPGATDTQANNASKLNNTGNMDQWLEVNATDLVGESDGNYALGASNFSVNASGICQGGSMDNYTYLNITDATLPKGNYTYNNGTAQEVLYFCLEESNSDLIAQYYSTGGTNSYGSWVIRVQNQ